MSTVTALVGSATLRDRRPQIAAALVSLLLHGLLVWWLLWGTPWSRDLPPEPQAMVFEMVMVSPPPEPTPRVLPPFPLIPLPSPDQADAPIAERLTPPPPLSPSVQPTRPRSDSTSSAPAPRPARALPEAGNRLAPPEAGRAQPGDPPRMVATQMVQQVILRQIIQRWVIDVRAPKFRDITVSWRFVLLPNGMLAPPFGRNDPWDLHILITGYDELLRPGNENIRTAAETFLQAARQAQPFQLPPDGKADEPRMLPLSFKLGDY